MSARVLFWLCAAVDLLARVAQLSVFRLCRSKHTVNGARVGTFTFKANSPVVLFHKEVKVTEVRV